MNHKLAFSWHSSSWFIAIMLALPIAALFYQAIGPSADVFQHLIDTVLLDYVQNTLALVFLVCLISSIIALPAAWLIAMCNFPGRKSLQWALMLPMAMPAYIVAYIYTDMFDYAGPVQIALRGLFGWQSASDYWFFDIRTIPGAATVLALVLYPYLYLLARTSFLEQSTSLIQASRVLGSSALSSCIRVSLPLARPAIAVGLSLIAMETVADFATVNYFAVNTLTTAVYDTWIGHGSLTAAAQLSVMTLSVILLFVGLERFARRKQQVFQKSMLHEQEVRYQLTGCAKLLAMVWCWLLVFAGFLLPFAVLVNYAWHYFAESWTEEFFQYSANSLILAVVVAGLAVLCAILLGLYRRLVGSKYATIPARISTMGYALPGTVLAIGIIIPLTSADFLLNDLTELLWDWTPGLVFTGTSFALVFAYLIRFSAIAVGSIESSIDKISPSLDMVTRTLGHSPHSMIRKVHIPLIRKGVLAAFLLVFIESMKELPTALLLRPFNYETLATYVFQFASDEMLEQAALAAIVIVLVGLIPLIFLNRSLEQQH
ncbi:Ferric iron ABC transporter, permease protein [Moritella sp. JT01]|uniref:ABC transporter permease n=1 Tax=Moritella sp. JT01 TaxID=756698 RepID=UPI00079B9172|nr:iron ABC transporter permease [Moritella sp. JT01]KXO10589.1 Ferric iron ABC transporter, permease protein [Moritella sp. JT01]